MPTKKKLTSTHEDDLKNKPENEDEAEMKTSPKMKKTKKMIVKFLQKWYTFFL